MRRLPSPVRPSARAALLVAVAAALSGCFQMANLITVRADGSGTVTETVTLSEQARAFAAMADTTGSGPLVDPATLEARAAALGADVRLLSVEETETGYTATYAFADVERLHYTMPHAPIGESGADSGEAERPYTFRLTRGIGPAPHTLVVTVPGDDRRDGAPLDTTAAGMAEEPQNLAMARALLGDARVAFRLAVEGAVVETDAAHRDGDTLTLADVEMGALIDLLTEYPELMNGAAPPLDQVVRLTAGREGLRIQPPGTVTVRFE